jgi:hypothetical protein
MMSMLCNCCVRELLILARTWFAFGLPSKTGCDKDRVSFNRLPLSNGPSDRVSFSSQINWEPNFLQGPPHN